MNQSKNKNLASLISLLMFVSSVVLWYFLILPQFNNFRDVSNKSTVATAKVEALDKNLKTLELLKNQLSSTINDQNKLDIAIPKETQIPEIFITIESIAQKADVDVISIKPENEAIDNFVKTTVVVEGEYPNIKNFMLGISNNIRPAVIESFKVIKNETESVSSGSSSTGETAGTSTTETSIETSKRSLQSEMIINFATAQKNTEQKTDSSATNLIINESLTNAK